MKTITQPLSVNTAILCLSVFLFASADSTFAIAGCDGTGPDFRISVSAINTNLSVLSTNRGAFVFKVSNTPRTPIGLGITYSGTAQNGVDVETLPTTVTFASGEELVEVSVIPKVAGPFSERSLTATISSVSSGDNPCVFLTPRRTVTITLTGPSAPEIIAQPQHASVSQGDNVGFQVQATGSGPLQYQWCHEEEVLVNAKASVLILTDVQVEQSGFYSVVVGNAWGVVISSDAFLEVNQIPIADASATPTRIISSNGTNATVALDGSRSSDPDGDEIAYRWLGNSGNVIGTNVVALETLPAGLHPITLVVTDGMASDTNRITIEIITLSEAADRLLAVVTDSGTGDGQGLIASLRAALASIDRRNPISAINQLQAFQSKVQTQVAPEDPVLAAEFIQQAQDTIDSLAAGQLGSRNLKALAHQDTDKFGLEFSGSAGAIYIIEASGDMQNWKMIGVARHRGDGQFDFEDPHAAKFPCRFYRVIVPK